MNEQELAALRALARQRTIGTEAARCPIVRSIAEAVAIAFSIPVEEITGRSRSRSVTEARQVCCFVARRCSRMSFSELGRALGLDHTTVIYAVSAVERRRVKDRWTASVCAVLLGQFGAVEESREQ